MSAQWPTHVAKARARRSMKHSTKKRNRRYRKLHASGKRGELSSQ